MVCWSGHALGAILACASSDGKVSVLEFKDDSWDTRSFTAHALGCNAVSWGPDSTPGSIVQSGASTVSPSNRRFATGGSDNLVKIWHFKYIFLSLFLLHSQYITIVTTLSSSNAKTIVYIVRKQTTTPSKLNSPATLTGFATLLGLHQSYQKPTSPPPLKINPSSSGLQTPVVLSRKKCSIWTPWFGE